MTKMKNDSDKKVIYCNIDNRKQTFCLYDFVEMLSQQKSIFETVRIVDKKISTMMQAEHCFVIMVNPATQHTVKAIDHKLDNADLEIYAPLQKILCGWILKYNSSLISDDVTQDPIFKKCRFKNLPIKSVIGVPLKFESNLVGSIIVVRNKKLASFNQQDLDVLEKMAIIAAPYLAVTSEIQQYFDKPIPGSTLLAKYKKLGLIGKSKKFLGLLEAVEAASRCDVRVLLEGENGTGKELVANAIHKLGRRNTFPFVAIDCGAIPSHLIESELFGHVRGAFTGATYDRKGLLEEANKGTLFMDEIANMPLDMQAKLMRVLQEKEVRPVGSNKSRKIDVRIIAASSIPLQKLVNEEQFREDLFYRLYVYPIFVPSLSQRSEDIPVLVNSFLKKFNNEQSKNIKELDPKLINFLKQRLWTGNVRELLNFVERLVTIAPADLSSIGPKLLPPDLLKEYKKNTPIDETMRDNQSLAEQLNSYEQRIIRATLVECDWNQTKAAKALQVSEQTIRYKMKKLNITKSL